MKGASHRRLAAVALVCALMSVLAARTEAAEDHPAFKNAKAPEDELVVTKSGSLPNGTRVTRAKQQVSGLDVLGAEAIFIDPPGASERIHADSTRTAIEPNTTVAKVTRGSAVDIATRKNRVEALRDPASARLALSPADDGTLVWVVVLPSRTPLADFETLLDATTGKVLTNRDILVHSQTGSAKIYDPNPVVANDGWFAGLNDNGDADSAFLTSLRTTVALPRIKDGQKCLKGDFVEALLYSTKNPVCKDSLNWDNTTRNKDRFEALMAYFHIDRAQAYIQSLGFTGEFSINNRRQKVLANSFKGDNAFYSPGSKKIELGAGGVDDGEDADILIHEYGHAMQDDTIPGYGTTNDANSLGEGFGDYWAAAVSAELSSVPDEFWNICIFDWDGVSYSPDNPPCGRYVDWSGDLEGFSDYCIDQFGFEEVHCMGQIWSSSLYGLRTALGHDGDNKSVMDRVVLFSHFFEFANVDFEDAANAVLCSDEAWYPTGTPLDCVGAHYTTIHDEFVDRGLLG